MTKSLLAKLQEEDEMVNRHYYAKKKAAAAKETSDFQSVNLRMAAGNNESAQSMQANNSILVDEEEAKRIDINMTEEESLCPP